jgi:uncharacterized protein (TIGR03435 family)
VDGAMLDIGSFSLKDLIRTAYEVKDYQITGPDWLNAGAMTVQRFNVQATLPEGATEKQVPQMLQALLADRFKLTIHRETKDHSVYTLVIGKGGLKLKESDPDPVASETPAEPAKGETTFGQGNNQVRITGSMENGKGMTVRGGPNGAMKMSMVDGKMRMETEKMTMAALAEVVTRFVDRPVVDMTELKGNYKVTIELSMDEVRNMARSAGVAIPAGGPGGGGAASSAPAEGASDPSGGTIFMSIQQMGLKLEARKALVPIIVVDHLEKAPTEN